MSIDTSLSNLGTVLNDYSQPKFYNMSGGLSLGMWVGFLTCVFSMAIGVGTYIFDQRREVHDKRLNIVFDCFMESHQDLEDEDNSEQVNLKAITRFPLSYWLVVMAYSLYSMGVCLFDNVASEFFRTRFGMDNETAGIIIAIPSFIVIFLTPLFGFLIDRIGGKTVFSTLHTSLTSLLQ